MKTETIQKYLERGGTIARILVCNELLPLSVTGEVYKRNVKKEGDDYKDGESPNLKWENH